MKSLLSEVQKLRGSNETAEKASNRITELEAELRRLRIQLEKEQEEKQDVISEKEEMRQKYEKVHFCWKLFYIYSRTSMARTPMAPLPWLIRTHFWVPTKFFR